jgi:hypothetical protein
MRKTIYAAFALVFMFAGAARADTVDGDWCRADGKRISIHGPEIVTPGGQRIQGVYTRHYFEYVIPAGEAGANDKVFITLQNEQLAHARQGAADAAIQVWIRCLPGVS